MDAHNMDIEIGLRACASAMCGNCRTAEMWDWCGEHIAGAFMVLKELYALECTCNAAWIHVLPLGLYYLCMRMINLNGMQESNVCLFCDIWLQVVYLTNIMHGQNGQTPLLVAARNGPFDVAQLLAGERCQHWSHRRGTLRGKCSLFNSSWMVAMWSGEHPLGLLTTYAKWGSGTFKLAWMVFGILAR